MSCRLVVFARQPAQGRVKTRLAGTIGSDAAARVYARLLHHALTIAAAAVPDVLVALAEPADPQWTSNLDRPFETQGGADLGERMAECFRRRFVEGAAKVVIVGSDNACVNAEHLDSAFGALGEAAVVLGPADDGGYWLIGQRSPGVDLFSDIPWSSPDTLAVTRDRLRSLGVGWHELETLPDIDTAEDLRAALHDPRVPSDLKRALRESLPVGF